MVTLVERILKLLLSEKGRDVHRVVMLGVICYVAWRVTEVERAVSEHLGYHKGKNEITTSPKSRLSRGSKLDASQLGSEGNYSPGG